MAEVEWWFALEGDKLAEIEAATGLRKLPIKPGMTVIDTESNPQHGYAIDLTRFTDDEFTRFMRYLIDKYGTDRSLYEMSEMVQKLGLGIEDKHGHAYKVVINPNQPPILPP